MMKNSGKFEQNHANFIFKRKLWLYSWSHTKTEKQNWRQFAKSEVFNVFVFLSAYKYFLHIDVSLFPPVAFMLFRYLSHKNAW